MKIEIGNLYFLIFIPIVLAFMYYSFKKYKPWNKNEIVIFISRTIIFTLLILALGNITLNLKGRNISTVFLLDVSESTSDFEESGKDFISTALEKIPRGNKAGVVLFTRSSVHCAESITAIANSKGVSKFKLHFASGYVFFNNFIIFTISSVDIKTPFCIVT